MKRETKANENEKRVVFRKFDSVTELSEFIKNTPQTKEGERVNLSRTGSYDFCGTHNFDEAEKLLLYGDSENAEKVRKNIEKITAGLKGKNKSFKGAKTLSYSLKSSAVGFLPIVPKYLAGEPENMLTLHKVQKKTTKVLNVFVYNNAPYCFGADEVNPAMCRMLLAILMLEKEGFRVNIFFTDLSEQGKGCFMLSVVKIKDSGQKLDLLKIAYPLCNPSFKRRHLFAVRERTKDSRVKLKSNHGAVCLSYEAEELIRNQNFNNFAVISFINCKDKNVGEISDFIKSQF